VCVCLAKILIELHGLCAAVLTYTLFYIPVEHVYMHSAHQHKTITQQKA